MKFTLSWLKDYLETDATLETIVETLTMVGLEVEELDDRSAFKPFVVAKVLTAEKHPDADKLQVLSVDVGADKPVQVVCGAPNARAGLIGAFAAPGTYVPGIDITLSVGNIRGVESHGMMCSERELNLSDEHDGIIDLKDEPKIGSSFAAYAGLDDPIIEIGLTPNRPDCTSVHGIARDLAAAGIGTLKNTDVAPIAGEGECPVNVSLEFGDTPSLCPGFALRMVRGVKNGPSPKWMQARLLAIGLRPISMLVDITNYITYDRGRPLHVFDADKIKGNLSVRRGRDGEKILALDEREYEVNPNICVIADDNGLESIAGVMGGEHSGCDENTTNVLIESAMWDPANIARTGRDLGIITDARYRFERGVDPEFMTSGMELGTKYVLEHCGGSATRAQIIGADNGAYTLPEKKNVSFPVSEVLRLTGLAVDTKEAHNILSRLGFEVDGTGDIANVSVPTWRPDVDGKADLVEEIMRIRGVNEIKSQPLESIGSVNAKILTTLQIRTRLAKRSLASRGMLEAVTWSFISGKQAEAFGGGQPELRLANPIAADMSDMRPSLLPSLLLAAQRNADKGVNDLALFEVSGIYQNDTPEGQRRVASGIRRGASVLGGQGRHWSGNAKTAGVYDAKEDALAVIEALGMSAEKVQITRRAPSWFHPGRSGAITLGPKKILGYFGEFHPRTLEELDVSGALCGFEIFIDALPEPKRKATRTKSPLILSQLQSVKRDFAFVMDKSVDAALILRAAKGADKKLITSVSIFDVFEGASLGEDKKSVAIEVQIQPQNQTMTDEDLERLSAKITANVEKTTGGQLRG